MQLLVYISSGRNLLPRLNVLNAASYFASVTSLGVMCFVKWMWEMWSLDKFIIFRRACVMCGWRFGCAECTGSVEVERCMARLVNGRDHKSLVCVGNGFGKWLQEQYENYYGYGEHTLDQRSPTFLTSCATNIYHMQCTHLVFKRKPTIPLVSFWVNI